MFINQANYVIEKGLGGAFIWSLEMDDFKGTCGSGPYPLLSTISKILIDGRTVEVYKDNKFRNQASKRILFGKEKEARDAMNQDASGSKKMTGRFGDKIRPTSETTNNDEDNLDNNFIDYTKPTSDEFGVKRAETSDDYDSRDQQKAAVVKTRHKSYFPSGLEPMKYSHVRYGDKDRRAFELTRAQTERATNSNLNEFEHLAADEQEVLSENYLAGGPPRSAGGLPRSAGGLPRLAGGLPRSAGGPPRPQRTLLSWEHEVDEMKHSNRPIDQDNFSKFNIARTKNSSSFDSWSQRPVYPPPKYDEDDVPTPRINQHERKREDTVIRGPDEPEFEERTTRQPPIQREANQHVQSKSERTSDRQIQKNKSTLNQQKEESSDLKCDRAGLFPLPHSCRSYYICVPHGTNWYKFHLTCPEGLGFRIDNAACGRVDDCKE